MYRDIIGDYQVVVYYENICFNGVCYDATAKIVKITDTVESLMALLNTGQTKLEVESQAKIKAPAIIYPLTP